MRTHMIPTPLSLRPPPGPVLRRRARGLGLAGLVFGVAACGEIKQAEGQGCSVGTDCIYPAVCCTQPRIPAFGSPIPQCENLRYCDAMLPVLVAGNPCDRAFTMTRDGQRSALELCGEPWSCCPKTLTCQTEAACEAAPEPTPTPSTGADCRADYECTPGEICMGLTIQSRQGTCQALVEGVAPDAGVDAGR